MNPLESLFTAFVDGTVRIGFLPALAFVILIMGFFAFGQTSKTKAAQRTTETALIEKLITQNREERDAERRERASDERLEMLLERVIVEFQTLHALLLDVNRKLSLKNGDNP